MNSATTALVDRQSIRRLAAQYALVPLRLLVGYGFLAHGLAKYPTGPNVQTLHRQPFIRANNHKLPTRHAWYARNMCSNPRRFAATQSDLDINGCLHPGYSRAGVISCIRRLE